MIVPIRWLGGLMMMLGGFTVAASTVHEFTLDNGLKLLVREDHRAPVVVSQIWYKVGSSYEPNGITGISHLLEHMMFKGTAEVPSGEFSEIIAANGGSQNAFTSRDYTAYFQTLQKARLSVSFRLEADRMTNLLLDDEELRRELKVVIEERRLRTEDAPERLTYEQLVAIAFLTSPYRHPIIGWMGDLEAMQAEDVRNWYQQWYAPNNATVVVVGDVDPQQVLALAETHFGPLKPRDLQELKPPAEIVQRGERRIVLNLPAEVPYVLLGYKVPVLKQSERDWEPYALQVLSAVLSGGESGRLSRNLIRGAEVATSAWASYRLTARLDDLLVLGGNPAPGADAAAVEAALRGEVRRLHDELVGSKELSRVVAQVIAEEIYQRDSMFYQGMRLGALETVGLGWRVLEDYVERIKSVTPDQVREVARRYLRDDRATVATLKPLPMDSGQGQQRRRSPGPMKQLIN